MMAMPNHPTRQHQVDQDRAYDRIAPKPYHCLALIVASLVLAGVLGFL
ncbi:hypothetical protein [Lacticaseibacillus suibinensis]|nr:hypothetical protein [Lacticaseibacillus suibinensis]